MKSMDRKKGERDGKRFFDIVSFLIYFVSINIKCVDQMEINLFHNN